MHQNKLISKLRSSLRRICSTIHLSSRRVANARRYGVDALFLVVTPDPLRKSLARTNPAKGFSKNLRYFSYSIPLVCIMLLSPVALLMPKHAYANTPCRDSSPDAEYQWSTEYCEFIPILTPTETFTIDKTTSTTPTAILKIDNSTSAITDKINSSYGVTNYASHTVSVSVTEAGSYSLILSGPAQLSGPSTINATSGATGTNLANDTWGYAWENTTVTDANANYKALGSSVNLAGTALSNRAASFSKKLIFAAKFDKATAGIYHADVKLSLVATPEYATTTVTAANAVPWNKLVYMQDMTEYACMQADIGDSKTLKDIRDKSTYIITKLSDGKCWMAQNLRITNKNTSKFDTNLASDQYGDGGGYYIPASAAWTDTSNTGNHAYYNNDTDYGAYYTWYTATAGTSASTYDICPKGWRLPTGGSSGEFKALADKYPTNYSSGLTWKTLNGKNGHWLGAADAASGGAFFPAAGYMITLIGALDNVTHHGYYWSSTPNSSYADNLFFYNTGINPASSGYRYYGFSVRCVAK